MNELIEEAKRLTKEYAAQNDCYATFDIENEFHGLKLDNEVYEVIHYTFYAKPFRKGREYENEKINSDSLEFLIKELKTLVIQRNKTNERQLPR